MITEKDIARRVRVNIMSLLTNHVEVVIIIIIVFFCFVGHYERTHQN